jgi:hypothetical protein
MTVFILLWKFPSQILIKVYRIAESRIHAFIRMQMLSVYKRTKEEVETTEISFMESGSKIQNILSQT